MTDIASQPETARDGSADDAALAMLVDALRAAAAGDFSRSLGERPDGPLGEAHAAFEELMARLARGTDDIASLARIVGEEGRLDRRLPDADLPGGWAASRDAINRLVDDLVRPTAEVARVIDAVAEGDLSQSMATTIEDQPLRGEFARIGATVNEMVLKLSAFADEVTRVAREVGTDGRLGGQAQVPGVAGTWKDLTDNVNVMARNLTDQVRGIAQVTTAVAQGDLSGRVTVEAKGEVAVLADTINEMVERLGSFADEVTRVAREVGTEGRLGGQAGVPGVAGTWKDLTDKVNVMAANLTAQVRGIAVVTTAVAQGDLSRMITVDAQGEVLELKHTINTMVEQLRAFASEVTRVAREVGTEGRLGGQAAVPGAAGTWADLTENVNVMARNLTEQVREIADVTTAVAMGDLSQLITVDVRGEVAEWKDTVNTMVEQLRSFADEVTRVAREVGTEGRLGGQAQVPGVAGTWKALTDNVNQLAANLTTQVRAIADVSTAVTQGDLTRAIDVEAEGEVAELAGTINHMVGQLRATTRVNAEQDWLKTNLARITALLQGQRDLGEVARLTMREVTPVVSARHGAFFLAEEGGADAGPGLRLSAGYAYVPDPDAVPPRPERFRLGEGLVGQAALEGRAIVVDDLPPAYLLIASGLGAAPPATVLVLPIVFEGQVLGVLELAALRPFAEVERTFLDSVAESLGVAINTIRATMRTEELLAQSQALTSELTKQAAQLELSSGYKSEFLANMSHELRTPLNSLLILSRLLADNPDGTLSRQQVEFAQTIHSAGGDLLALINDILDLSKVEAGRMELAPAPVSLAALCADLERQFRPVAAERSLRFAVTLDPALPEAIVTDEQRLGQVLRNLLSNACKFTPSGGVALEVAPVGGEVAFAVRDSGIGIAREKLGLVFEAFQQADGTTSRQFGGTGLGLSISRELARLLGGDVTVSSEPGRGSTFTLRVPVQAGMRALPAAPVAALPPTPVDEPAAPPAPVASGDDGALPDDGIQDDRAAIAPGEACVLVVCDDCATAGEALEAVRATGRRALGARRAPTALALAREHRPEAVVLLGGSSVLPHLKLHPETRHVPVYVASSAQDRVAALRAGAAGHLGDARAGVAVLAAVEAAGALRDAPRRLAVVGTGLDAGTRALLDEGDDVEVVDVPPSEALAGGLEASGARCVVVCLGADPATGVAVLEAAGQSPALRELAWLAYAPVRLDRADRARLDAFAGVLDLTLVGAPERLVDATVVRLHREESHLPARVRSVLGGVRTGDDVLRGRRVLVVDDDVRNVFALASVLEQRGMRVDFAEDGREALGRLREGDPVDLVLLDVMMPGMDGYETARAIRAMPRFETLPIISLTAKAMRGDRDKSLAAGASDYIAKPVDVDALLALIRVWLTPR